MVIYLSVSMSDRKPLMQTEPPKGLKKLKNILWPSVW
jgi:hypothetical protein